MSLLKKYAIYLEILFILLLSLIPLLWFKPEHMIFGSDSGYPLDYVQYFIQRTFTWTSSQSFGEDMSSFMGALPLHGIQYLLTIIGVPYFDIQKVTLVFWFSAVALSMYFCVRYFFRKPEHWVVRLTAVSLYSINFYIFLFWQIGSQTTLSAYALLPLCFLIIFLFLDKKISALQAAIYFNLSYVFFNAGGIGGVPLLGPIIVVLLGAIFYQAIFTFSRKYILNVLTLIFISGIIFLGINAYFLLPFLSTFSQQFDTLVVKSGGIGGVIEWTRYISKFDSYTNLFRLQGDNIWYVNGNLYAFHFLNNPMLIIASFIFPIFAYLPLIFKNDNKTKKIILFLLALSLIGIFLSAGAHDPLGFIYVLMIKFIPGFAAFRSAFYKFMPLIIFSFSILIGFSIYYITRNLKNRFKTIIFFVFITFIFLYHYPFFDVGNFTTNNTYDTMITIPEYVKKFRDEKPPPDSISRTMVLPPLNGNFGVEIYDWNYYSGYPIFPGVSDKPYVQNNAYLKDGEKLLVNRLYSYLREENYENFFELSKKLSIKYILLTSDIVTNNPDGSREQPGFYSEKLRDNRFKIVWQSGEWSIYEISEEINPSIFTFNSLSSISPIGGLIPPDLENQNFTGVTLNLPTVNTVTILPCESCNSLNSEHLEAPMPRILPHSLFYPLKNFFLKKKTKEDLSASDRIYENLGESMKKLGELKGLAQFPTVPKREEWIKAVDAVLNNWKDINQSIDKLDSENYLFTLNRIKNYSEYEIVTLKDISNYESVGNDVNLLKSIIETISVIINVQDNALEKIYTISNPYSYTFKNDKLLDEKDYVIVDIDSLPKDTQGNVIFPISVKYDGNRDMNLTVSEDNDIFLPLPQNDYSNINILFPDRNNEGVMFSEEHIKASFFQMERCIVASILDYKWYKSYSVSARTNGPLDNLRAYVLFDTTEKQHEVINPNKTIDIEKANINFINLKITGKESDKYLKLYFCSDPGRDPQLSYKDIKISEVYTPILYSSTENTNYNFISPSISYEKINPVEYEINVSSASTPYFLAFSDRYSDFWKLIDEESGVELDIPHFPVNGYANAWYIEKKGNYKLKMFFKQQEIFYAGVKVSLITLACVMLFLLYKRIKHE